MKTGSRDQATRRALRIEAELASGYYAPPPPPMSVTAAKEEWLKTKEDERRSCKTRRKYGEWLDRFDEYPAERGAQSLHQLTPKLFDGFRVVALQGRSEEPAYDGLTIVKSFVKWVSGGGRDYLPKNPLTGCKVPKP